MEPENPYGKYIEGRDPIVLMGQTPDRIKTLVENWPAANLRRSYAPGKWEARQILLHLAHVELALANRVRMALSAPDYVVQPFDQDEWMKTEPVPDGLASLHVYYGLRQLTLACARNLTAERRAHTFTHPERGTISVNWLFVMLAGHDIHHLRQLETI